MRAHMLPGWFVGTALVFCLTAAEAVADGMATASITVEGTTYTFSGGSCTHSGDILSVNFGVPSFHAPAGTLPDYFGVTIPKAPGHFEDGIVSLIKDGKRYTVGRAAGEATASGASFSGKLMRGGGLAEGSFRC